MTALALFAVVVLERDVPEDGLRRGDIGTIIHMLDGAYEVEFLDEEGRTHAVVALRGEDLSAAHSRRSNP